MIITYSRKIRWNEIGAPILNYKQKLENLESESRHMETVKKRPMSKKFKSNKWLKMNSRKRHHMSEENEDMEFDDVRKQYLVFSSKLCLSLQRISKAGVFQ